METPRHIHAKGPMMPDLTVMSPYIQFGFAGLVFALLAIVSWVIYKIASWVFGPDGWCKRLGEKLYDRFNDFCTRGESAWNTISTRLTTHTDECERIHQPCGPSNVEDMRRAGHAAADAFIRLGCEQEGTRMHDALGNPRLDIPLTESVAAMSFDEDGKPNASMHGVEK